MTALAYFPRQAGGLQMATKSLARGLAARGHDVAVAAELSFRGAAGLRSAVGLLISRAGYSRETYDGRTVYRARNITAHAGAIAAAFKPDCVVVQSMDAMALAHELNARGIPLVICWHDVETHRMNGKTDGLVARYVANSDFTAAVYEREFGVSSVVIPPLIDRASYVTEAAARRQVTFVNPVAEKGLELAIAIAARCPDIDFEFVESWILEADKKRALLQRISPYANIRFTPHQDDIRPVYARTRVLLAPSQWREAWGRVASEAHISGIPVLASRIGGLVEAVGDGGILVEPDAPAQAWADALRSIWDDPARYAELSARALDYSKRQVLNQDWAADAMLTEIDAARAMRGDRQPTY